MSTLAIATSRPPRSTQGARTGPHLGHPGAAVARRVQAATSAIRSRCLIDPAPTARSRRHIRPPLGAYLPFCPTRAPLDRFAGGLGRLSKGADRVDSLWVGPDPGKSSVAPRRAEAPRSCSRICSDGDTLLPASNSSRVFLALAPRTTQAGPHRGYARPIPAGRAGTRDQAAGGAS